MKARITSEGEITILEISGYLDFDSAFPIRQSLEQIYKTNQSTRLVVDLGGLEFVGSSGVSTFVKSLTSFNKMKMKPTYFGVKSEFMKLFRAFEEEDESFDVTANKESAQQAALLRYQEWQIKNPRSKRTH